MISDPSYDAFEIPAGSLPYDFRASRRTVCHAIRAVGAGTVTVLTVGAGTDNPRTWTVKDGELIPCEITAIQSVSGPTAIRAHIPRFKPSTGQPKAGPGPA